MIIKAKTILFTSCLLVLGYVLFQIPILRISNVVAQPIPIQTKNESSIGNVTHTSNANAHYIGNASAKTSMLPYVNRLNGIFMLYPSSWQASVSGLPYPALIRFYSPLQNISDFLPAQVSVSVIKYENNSITLAQYTKLTLALLNKSQEQKQLTIANPKPIIVAGYPGYRVVFSLLPSSNMTSELRTLETWTVVDSRVYLITYVAEPTKFIKYLPQVTQMLTSLRISQTP